VWEQHLEPHSKLTANLVGDAHTTTTSRIKGSNTLILCEPLVWLRIDAEARRADALAAQANLRGDAVSVLAGEVRVLREQVKAAGKTPAAPDPSRAVDDLPARQGAGTDPRTRGPRGP
jgi:hypothetical protein